MTSSFNNLLRGSETPPHHEEIRTGGRGAARLHPAREPNADTTKTSDVSSAAPPHGGATPAARFAWATSAGADLPTAAALKRELWRTEARALDRIEVDREVKGGRPTIRGTKITVSQIYLLAAEGLGVSEIVDQFDGLVTRDDVVAALRFAAGLTA